MLDKSRRSTTNGAMYRQASRCRRRWGAVKSYRHSHHKGQYTDHKRTNPFDTETLRAITLRTILCNHWANVAIVWMLTTLPTRTPLLTTDLSIRTLDRRQSSRCPNNSTLRPFMRFFTPHLERERSSNAMARVSGHSGRTFVPLPFKCSCVRLPICPNIQATQPSVRSVGLWRPRRARATRG